MTCIKDKKPISIYKGFGTKWDNNSLLAVSFDSEISVVGFGAEFIIGNIKKNYENIQNGFTIDLTAEESGTLDLGPTSGTLNLIDLENNTRPFTTQLPFIVKDWVSGDIQLDGYQLTIKSVIESNELNINIETSNPLAINEETIRAYILVHNLSEEAHPFIQDRITANTEKFANYRTSEEQDIIDATLETSEHASETYATKSELTNGLSGKQDTISDLSTIRANALAGKNASTTISEYGNIVTHNTTEFATASQGELAESALQSGNNITELTNNAGYITGIDGDDVSEALGYTPLSASDISTVATTGSYNDLSNKPTIGSGTLTIQKNSSTIGSFSANATSNMTINVEVPTNNIELLNGAGYITEIDSSDVTNALGYTPYNSTNPNNYQTGMQVSNAVDTEASLRESADNNLQSQIDAVTASSDVKDIVGTYEDLEDYDTSTLGNNDIIKVLQDETHSDETTYYRWSTSTDSFDLIGEEGPYYTKSEANNTFVPVTRTVNGKGLYENITLTAGDVGALPDSTVIPTVNNATLTIQKNGTNLGTFTANASVDKTLNITVPTTPADIGAVAANTAITGATKCKITYDAKGLVTAGADLDVGDIPSLPTSKLSGVTASAEEINVLDGVEVSTTEINCLDEVSGNIQTQLNGKQATLISGTNIKTVNNISLLGEGNIAFPSPNNGRLTIQQNEVDVATFTADSASNVTANITVPTQASDIDALPDSTKYGADLSYSSNTLQLLDQDGSALGNSVTIQSSPDIDEKSITLNSGDELQTVGVIDQNNTSTAVKTWTGTKNQYDLIQNKDANTIYNVIDEDNDLQSLLETIYPVGSIYIGTMNICPLSALFGTWQLVAQDRVLQGAGSRGNVGTTVNESLPNIRGRVYGQSTANTGNIDENAVLEGCFERDNSISNNRNIQSYSTYTSNALKFNANVSSSTYQDNAPVQQDAYLVNIWQRTA